MASRLKFAAASFLVFLCGILRRSYYWIPTFLLDPLDWYETYLKPNLPRSYRLEIDMPSSWFPYVFGIGVSWAAFCTYLELCKEKYALEERCTSKLAIEFQNKPPYIQEQQSQRLDGSIIPGRLFRVGIRNLSSQTIQRVEVELERTEPSTLDFLPVPLRFMHDNPLGDHEYQRSFPLDGGTERFIDLALKYRESADIWICHTVRGVPNTVPIGSYVFTISAHGQDSPGCRREFIVGVENENDLVVGSVPSRK